MRAHDAELEMTHAGISLQLGVEGRGQQGEGADQLKPSTPLVVVQPSERLGPLWAPFLFGNKLTLQPLIGYQLEASTSGN